MGRRVRRGARARTSSCGPEAPKQHREAAEKLVRKLVRYYARLVEVP